MDEDLAGNAEQHDVDPDEADTKVLAQIKADPGNASLNTTLAEFDNLHRCTLSQSYAQGCARNYDLG